MANIQPTGIQLHSITGHKRMFYQESPELVERICNDFQGHIFARKSLVIESSDHVTAVPGAALIGITVLTDPLPAIFLERERTAKTVITQISQEVFQFRRLQNVSRLEGERSSILSELEFVSGEHLFLEFSEIALSGMGERSIMNHLFSRPSLFCRRVDAGFSIWNTAHIVLWSHYPKMEVPANSWPAEHIENAVPVDAKRLKML